MIRGWWRWNKEQRRLRREVDRLQLAWWRASYAYKDAAVVYADTPGAWSDAGPIGAAMTASQEAHAELVRARQAAERWERT